MGSQQVENLGAAVNPHDAVRKNEFDVTFGQLALDHVRRDGTNTMKGDLDMGGHQIVNVDTTAFPNLDSDVATKKYTDDTFGSIASVATGTIIAFAGATVPSGWQLCDGRSLDTTAFSALFGVIGYTYGGSGSTFNVPDLRGRTLAGFDNYDGKVTTSPPASAGAASRLDNFGNSSDFNGGFGSQEHALTTPELPSHTHDYDDAYMATGSGAGLQGVSSPDSVTTLQDVSPQPSTDATGSGTAHNNVQPTMVMPFIIKS
jgi:microcystin-dependent protein